VWRRWTGQGWPDAIEDKGLNQHPYILFLTPPPPDLEDSFTLNLSLEDSPPKSIKISFFSSPPKDPSLCFILHCLSHSSHVCSCSCSHFTFLEYPFVSIQCLWFDCLNKLVYCVLWGCTYVFSVNVLVHWLGKVGDFWFNQLMKMNCFPDLPLLTCPFQFAFPFWFFLI